MSTTIAGMPVSFDPRGKGGPIMRETVLIGVIPIGAIEKLPTGRWCWSVDLPLVRQMHGAPTLESARERVLDVIAEWFEAAATPSADVMARVPT